MKKILLLGLLAALSACTTTQANQDPYETSNRKIFEFNQRIDRAILNPVADAYNGVVPAPARKGVTNALTNLREPMTFANEILQFKPVHAGETVLRFAINSTIGILGLWNPAEKIGLKRRSEDIGQTLAVWGVKNPPYYVIPFVGPSTTRDTLGFTLTFMYEPVNLYIQDKASVNWVYLRLTADVVTIRAGLDKVLDDLYAQKDPYILARSAYLQARKSAIRDGKTDPAALTEEDDLFFDDAMNSEELAIYKMILKDKKRAARK